MTSRAPRIADIVFWSGLTNLVLLLCFFTGWNFDHIRVALFTRHAEPPAAAKGTDPLALSRLERRDNELLTRGPQRQLKGSLQVTDVPPSESGAARAAPQADPGIGLSGALEQGDGQAEDFDAPAGPEGRSPVLRGDPRGGKPLIGSFATVSLTGDASECLDTGYGLVSDAGVPRDSLEVLANSRAITVARICAGNGSVVITCRSDQITISPRRPRPGDGCQG